MVHGDNHAGTDRQAVPRYTGSETETCKKVRHWSCYFPECVLRLTLSPYDMVIFIACKTSYIHILVHPAFWTDLFPSFYKVILHFAFSLSLNRWGWLPAHPAPDELDPEWLLGIFYIQSVDDSASEESLLHFLLIKTSAILEKPSQNIMKESLQDSARTSHSTVHNPDYFCILSSTKLTEDSGRSRVQATPMGCSYTPSRLFLFPFYTYGCTKAQFQDGVTHSF